LSIKNGGSQLFSEKSFSQSTMGNNSLRTGYSAPAFFSCLASARNLSAT
jgi:hypothetical protein